MNGLYFIQTFGCQMNTADSERLAHLFWQMNIKPAASAEEADILIFNTCSVRQKGEDRVFGLIKDIYKSAKKEGRTIYIGVTGCMTRKTGIARQYLDEEYEKQKTKGKITTLEDGGSFLNADDDLFRRSPRIDFVFRVEDAPHLPKLLSFLTKQDLGDDEKQDNYLKLKQSPFLPHAANIVIQTGCDNYCSYCIVPYARGHEQSRNSEHILADIREAVAKWATEIRLLGQNVNSYGKENHAPFWNEETSSWISRDTSTPFRQLLDQINEIEGINRVRFTSSNPHDMTQDILASHFDNKTLCHYLHFAMQSGDDTVLKNMNRKHTYADFKAQVDYLRSRDPFFAISTDIIVGFPWETEEQFENTKRAFSEIAFDFAYIARYSPRKGTLSAKNMIDDVSASEKARRWHELNELLKITTSQRLEMTIGQNEEILIDGYLQDGRPHGRTRTFKEASLPLGHKAKMGDIISVKIVGKTQWTLLVEEIC